MKIFPISGGGFVYFIQYTPTNSEGHSVPSHLYLYYIPRRVGMNKTEGRRVVGVVCL